MELVCDNADYGVVEGEPPELLGRNLASAGHLLASATAFFFLAFVFAYFYLRSLNNAGMWKPKHVDTSVTWGTIVTACIVVSAMFWLETVLATSIRYRGWHEGKRTVGPGQASGDAYREGHDIRDPVSLVRAELGALSFYWTFLAGTAVLAWVVLYL